MQVLRCAVAGLVFCFAAFAPPASAQEPPARAIIDKLSAALSKTVAMPEVVARFATVGLEPAADTTPDGLAETIRQNQHKYAREVNKSSATAD